MLTPDQKAAILRKTGTNVPVAPANGLVSQDQPGAMLDWIAAVNTMFVTFSAGRAAKSLRDAEQARVLGVLRQMAGAPFGADPSLPRA